MGVVYQYSTVKNGRLLDAGKESGAERSRMSILLSAKCLKTLTPNCDKIV